MNERTRFFIKIYLSHFILERVMFLVCERLVETRTDCYIDPMFFFDHSSTFFHLSLVAQPWVTESLKPSVCRWLSLRHLFTNWLQLTRTAPSTWLYYCLTSTCFRCSSAYLHRCTFTHLINGSVEGRYITYWVSNGCVLWHINHCRNQYIYIYIYIYIYSVCVCVCVCVYNS